MNKEITPIVKYQETKEYEKQIQGIITNIKQSKHNLEKETLVYEKKSSDFLLKIKPNILKMCHIKNAIVDVKVKI